MGLITDALRWAEQNHKRLNQRIGQCFYNTVPDCFTVHLAEDQGTDPFNNDANLNSAVCYLVGRGYDLEYHAYTSKRHAINDCVALASGDFEDTWSVIKVENLGIYVILCGDSNGTPIGVC